MPNEMSKGELTRREIVKKAAPLFNRKGYEGTSLSDLMQATGLQKGGIYRHFSSKQQLAGEAFDYSWEKAVSGRLEGVNEVPNSVHRLRKMIHTFLKKTPAKPHRAPPQPPRQSHRPPRNQSAHQAPRSRSTYHQLSRRRPPPQPPAKFQRPPPQHPNPPAPPPRSLHPRLNSGCAPAV